MSASACCADFRALPVAIAPGTRAGAPAEPARTSLRHCLAQCAPHRRPLNRRGGFDPPGSAGVDLPIFHAARIDYPTGRAGLGFHTPRIGDAGCAMGLLCPAFSMPFGVKQGSGRLLDRVDALEHTAAKLHGNRFIIDSAYALGIRLSYPSRRSPYAMSIRPGAVLAGSDSAVDCGSFCSRYLWRYRAAGFTENERCDVRRAGIRPCNGIQRRRIPAGPARSVSPFRSGKPSKMPPQSAAFSPPSSPDMPHWASPTGDTPPIEAPFRNAICGSGRADFSQHPYPMTLKREELVRNGRGAELDELIESTCEFQ